MRGKNGHEYPSRYMPSDGQPWFIRESWRILDTIGPGEIPHGARCLLAGMIAGALSNAAEHGPLSTNYTVEVE